MGTWISWTEASELTGFPVPTIDYAKRLGRIEHRPAQGTKPSLNRDSVIAWAAWYTAERKAIEDRRTARTERPIKVRPFALPLDRPDPTKWATVAAAAERLNFTTSTVLRMYHLGDLIGQMGDRLWVSVDSIEAHLIEEAKWCTSAEAAALIGCRKHHVVAMIAEGALRTREVARCKPFVNRESAAPMRPVWEEQQEARLAATRDRLEELPRNAPPEDSDVWLSPPTAALVIGITASAVRQRVYRGTIPAVRKPARVWLRRSDVEIAAAARVFARSADRL